jgi:hypothetical protein
MLRNLIENLRQMLYYSKEFRIAAPKWWDLSGVLSTEAIVKMIQVSKTKAETSLVDNKGLMNLTTEIGTSFWRLQHRINAGGEPPQEMKRVLRDVESMEDALKQANIEVKDQTGQKYVDGMALKVLARQVTPGITCETIIETIKPTIYCGNTLMQQGEVIVGIPESETSSEIPKPAGGKEKQR